MDYPDGGDAGRGFDWGSAACVFCGTWDGVMGGSGTNCGTLSWTIALCNYI